MPSLIKRTIAGAALGGAAIWGIGGVDDTTRNDSGQIIESGDLGVFVTQVGDCFNLEDPTVTAITVTQGVPCSSPHNWQVIYKGDLAISEYDKTEIDNQANRICDAAVERLLNNLSFEKLQEYERAKLNVMTPTSESFENGDEAVDCLVGSDEEYFTTSLLD